MQPEEYINNNHLVQATIFLHDSRKVANPMTEGVILSAGKLYKISVTMVSKNFYTACGLLYSFLHIRFKFFTRSIKKSCYEIK